MNRIGKIIKITGSKILVLAENVSCINEVTVDGFISNYISIGSFIGTNLVDGRTLVLTVEEVYDNESKIYVTTSVSGIYDNVSNDFSFGTNSYPLIGEQVYRIDSKVLADIFSFNNCHSNMASIGTYAYDPNVPVSYDPNVLFGKHLGVFGNTGSGKTCTVVSVIQRYIRNNPNSNIKFIILDVNGEYKTAFKDDEADYIPFDQLRFHHSELSNTEYGRLFRAAEGIQYPAMKECIEELSTECSKWDLRDLPVAINSWIDTNTALDKYGKKDIFNKNQINGYLRTMLFRIDGILNDEDLMKVINSDDGDETIGRILKSNKKVSILDLQVSTDSLDIVVYLFFKAVYQYKTFHRSASHICLVLEEAHRYINQNTEESKLGSYYIDKLSREGRKFGIGLIISSQVPSMLAYDVVSQCNSVIMHKITSRRDMDFLRGVLRVSNDTFYLQMSALEKQYAIVCGEAFSNDTLVRIHDAYPLPMSNDPIIG